jgi:hypothetical protein
VRVEDPRGALEGFARLGVLSDVRASPDDAETA